MSIADDRQLVNAHEALGNLYRALAALRAEYSHANPKAFGILAEGPLEEIRRIRLEIDEYTGFALAEKREAGLWLRLTGGRAKWRETPSSVLTAFLDSFRKGVQTVANYNAHGRVVGRLSASLQEACNFELVAFAPGSFQVGMRLPPPEQLELYESTETIQAREALLDFLRAADWAETMRSIEELNIIFPDAPKQRTVLRALKPFVPRPKGGIDAIELYGPAVPDERTIRLSREALQPIRKAFESAISEEEEQYIGDLREMDLDRRSFKLRNVPDAKEVACKYGDDFAAIAETMLGKKVRVIGTRRRTAQARKMPLEIVDIEKHEE
jgi:hypothetical protein